MKGRCYVERVERISKEELEMLMEYTKRLEKAFATQCNRIAVLELSQLVWIFTIAVLLATLCFGGDHVC